MFGGKDFYVGFSMWLLWLCGEEELEVGSRKSEVGSVGIKHEIRPVRRGGNKIKIQNAT